MKLSSFTVGLLAALTPLAAAWSKEDSEIFRVRSELAPILGSDVTFYDFVGVSPTASQDEISKAYRKKTRSLHPDKVKQQLAAERAKEKVSRSAAGKPPTAAEVRAAVKRASDMQARLSIVVNILRGPMRERYDYFLANGFPVWKGTGYYYNRYRPGFGTVLVGLFLFVGGAGHYLALYMSWKRHRAFVDRILSHARHSAWGETVGDLGVGAGAGALPLAAPQTGDDADAAAAAAAEQQAMAMNRKQRRLQERDAKREAARENAGGRRAQRRAQAQAAAASSGTPTGAAEATADSAPTGARKRVVAQNGKILIVDSLGDVFLEQIDDDGNIHLLPLNADDMAPPSFRDTAVYRLPAWLYAQTAGRVLPGQASKGAKGQADGNDADADDSEDAGDSSSPGKATPSTDSNEEFELVDKTAAAAAAATGSSQAGNKNKASKRKNKKR